MKAAKLLRVARNPREGFDRLAQEAANLRLLLLPPSLPAGCASRTAALPDPALLRQRIAGTPQAARIAALAAEIRSRRFRLLGITHEFAAPTRWRRDWISGIETPAIYFRRIPYLDAARAGDHKVIWELNRHQHLVLLAQDVLLHDDAASLALLEAELTSWLGENPFQCGINWASALEVAFRALSWMWIAHLAGDRIGEPLRGRFLNGLYQHGHHLAHNLSFYFSPNTHLLGESVALHALGVVFPDWPEAERWRALGHRTVAEQLERQIEPDGSHFERSSYYHVYALDMIVFHAHLAGCAAAWREPVQRMCRFLDALLGPRRLLPLIGDDDGGRFFHPFGEHAAYGRASLAAAGGPWRFDNADAGDLANWWFAEPPRVSEGAARQAQHFADSGLAVFEDGDAQIVFDTGNFGRGSAGHSHSDALSVIVNAGGREILIDPGTYTYVADPAAREAFRGSAGHNTVRVNGLDQATPSGPFAWTGRPETELTEWAPGPDIDRAAAVCRYGGFTHRRLIVFDKRARTLAVEDEVEGPAGEHTVEIFWHPADAEARSLLDLPGAVEEMAGWRSMALGERSAAPVAKLVYRGVLPWRYRWTVGLGDRLLADM